jgi:hypothetical protein
MRAIVVGVALTAFVLPAWRETRLSYEQIYQRSPQASHELRVFTYARWHKDC